SGRSTRRRSICSATAKRTCSTVPSTRSSKGGSTSTRCRRPSRRPDPSGSAGRTTGGASTSSWRLLPSDGRTDRSTGRCASPRTKEKTVLREGRRREQQQAALAELWRLALSGIAPDRLIDEALRWLTQLLDVELASLVELEHDPDRLHLRAGVGWREGMVGGT